MVIHIHKRALGYKNLLNKSATTLCKEKVSNSEIAGKHQRFSCRACHEIATLNDTVLRRLYEIKGMNEPPENALNENLYLYIPL